MDLNIQGIAEKYLKQACIDNECTDGGNVVIMSPKTGDILALAGYPDYNLNDPFAVDESLSKDEQTKQVQALWRNKAISDTYEPGSTFKLVTTSAALEEGITTPDKEGEFCCVGYIEVAGVKMKCWRYYKPHGPESLREALMNSCNPIFIGLGEKLGVHTYYKYLNNFGFFRQTGIDLPGEAKGIFLKEEKVGPVELGTIAFGQRFEITPIQMATMLSTIANKGVYIKPRVVKEIIKKSENTNEESENKNDSNEKNTTENNSNQENKNENSTSGENNEVVEKVEEVPVEQGDRVISEKTSSEILSMMQTVVDQGTGKNAKVEGYSIGGKTGTSEDGVNTGKYITSFIGVAPIEDPQIVVLLTLYNPKGEGGHSGGGIAAPVAGKIFKEVLEYLDVKKNN
jgi:stage V sporulation protein D (sporulation-specific penicillin-binding protein)